LDYYNSIAAEAPEAAEKSAVWGGGKNYQLFDLEKGH
jgi:hypothetical protein